MIALGNLKVWGTEAAALGSADCIQPCQITAGRGGQAPWGGNHIRTAQSSEEAYQLSAPDRAI